MIRKSFYPNTFTLDMHQIGLFVTGIETSLTIEHYRNGVKTHESKIAKPKEIMKRLKLISFDKTYAVFHV